MLHYRELSASAQTAYAELYERVHVTETLRSPAFVTGNVAYKTIKGSRYAYWAFKELDGRKREYYLGPAGPAIDAIERARSEGAPALESVGRQAASALALGCTATPPKHFRIVKRMAEYQFFRAGGLLVGTHAFLAIGNQLGVAWDGATRTLDLDFAHPGPGGNVALALPANLHVNMHDALTSLRHGFLPAMGGSKGMACLNVSTREPDLRIDFLTVRRRASFDGVPAPELGVALSPLKFLEYLIERPGQAVLLDRADACLVNLPDPARYGLHKLIVAHERGARHPKHGKDIAQAVALIEWHLRESPRALVDAWDDLTARGTGWSKRARASLAVAARTEKEIVQAFERLVAPRK
ncbi:GSU2403 family nucleotidyltransferase fold protein [Dokdonella sp.]|uniref:GSU2403 family nucleotidyltransferase fold protein n=1 Tax=Dokdonella sp. TaxID=2291710 RepID=UPI0025BF1B6B|nr:GSU2403 family nucleotidyltransferase fold protein [Dokdonella sp.]MBX3692420.1 nucleotidyltransferase domain-containing protein [Dokdonella sp.]MCW5566676.1 nucleotidyltransferase domain-containing protein [Dokdonella sp.]